MAQKPAFCYEINPMYAIIADSGRQYRVEAGQELDIDFREAEKGDKVTFETVLAVSGDDGLRLGKPEVSGATVTAEVLGAKMGEKLVVQKFRRRKNSRRKTGHRQLHTRVKIESING